METVARDGAELGIILRLDLTKRIDSAIGVDLNVDDKGNNGDDGDSNESTLDDDSPSKRSNGGKAGKG
ncbi:hypothetical protein AC578_4230 [Pseudocercospora eumusae]|uniref:Uncharacterized protein n=1 Tax=Pseudocercospora eumusae TaxID=321146 RepID=A0A139H371_9PEZI|nr:hypothetical protein AC578_4230 [Pseudocercospora eumusae]